MATPLIETMQDVVTELKLERWHGDQTRKHHDELRAAVMHNDKLLLSLIEKQAIRIAKLSDRVEGLEKQCRPWWRRALGV